LIELLVVIAIIAILAAILFPVFAQARDKAREVMSASNEKQIVLGIIMYTSDNNSVFPFGQDQNHAYNGSTWDCTGGNPAGSTICSGEGGGQWIGFIMPYIKSPAVFCSPDDAKAGLPSATDPTAWAGAYTSYGYNTWCGESAVDGWWPPVDDGLGLINQAWPPGWPGHPQFTPENLVTFPSSSIAIYETYSADDELVCNSGGPCPANGYVPPGNGFSDLYMGDRPGYGHGSFIFGADWGWGGQTIPIGQYNSPPAAENVFPASTNGGVSAYFASKTLSNYGFVDGHVKAMTPAQTEAAGNDWDDLRPVENGY